MHMKDNTHYGDASDNNSKEDSNDQFLCEEQVYILAIYYDLSPPWTIDRMTLFS